MDHPDDEDEEHLIRSVALQNTKSILVERQRVERELTEERERLRITLASIGDAVISTDAVGRVVYLNGVAEELTGWPQAEAAGRPLTDIFQIINEGTRQPVDNPALRALHEGRIVDLANHTLLVARDGTERPIDDSAAPMRDPTGANIGAVLVFRDVTEKHRAVTASKRAEAVLRESEGRHRFLADLAAVTQTLTDPGEVMASTARHLAEYLGCDRCAYAEVQDENVFVITGDYTRGVPSIVGRWPVAAFGAECERCMQANEPYVIHDVDADVRAGSDLVAYQQTNIQSAICVPLHKAGKFAAAMAVHQKTARHWTSAEIALVETVVGRCWESLERARVARDLKQAAERLALTLAAARLGDWSWDAATDMVTFASRAAEIFGIPPGPHMTWTKMQDLIHADDRDQARVAVERSIAERDQYDVEYRVRQPAGQEVWVSAKGRAQFKPDGSVNSMFGVVQDITEKKRLEGELIHRAAELADADRKKDDFIALLAHELRNPLAPIRTGLQVMRLAAGDAARVAKAQAVMERQLSHMVRLIDDLLDVSRVGRNKLHLQKQRVLLSEAVSHALETAGPSVEAAGHVLNVSLPADPVVLDADLTRLAQVLGNLLTNSAKYTPRGGQIWLAAQREGGEVVITVRDTGLGIPADALPTLFDMFSQVDRSVERVTGGLGIGLALVKGLVEAHGGSVAAASPGIGSGSTFTVRLPTSSVAMVASASVATEDFRSLRMGKKILLADDNQDVAESMAELLTVLGNEVHVASDGMEAVETAERVRPDLVLMDVGMPRLNGLDATRQIRAHSWGRAPTIVALTGWGQDGDREKSRAAGCNGHLVKPVTLVQLEKLLADLPPT